MLKMKVLILLAFVATPVLAWKPLGDIDKNILEAGKAIENTTSKVGEEIQKSVEYNKAQTICQEKCLVCFDGISCDFECAKQACIDGPGEVE